MNLDAETLSSFCCESGLGENADSQGWFERIMLASCKNSVRRNWNKHHILTAVKESVHTWV